MTHSPVALVTGASSGMGEASALALAEDAATKLLPARVLDAAMGRMVGTHRA